MKREVLNDYLVNGKIDIDKFLDDFYVYVYIIVKNTVSIHITDEDIEEILSDVFMAVWKNSNKLSSTTDIKAYLAGATKNIIRNKYRKTEINFSITDYEEKIIADSNLEKITEENEQNRIIKNTLKTLKKEEYKIFIKFYFEAKTINEITKELIAISNIRKEFGIKTNINKKIIYTISSVCAVFIFTIGMLVGTGQLNDNINIGENIDQKLNVKLNINKIKDMEMTKLDLDVKIVEAKESPDKFNFMEKIKIPSEYKLKDRYNVYTRKDMEVTEYNVLHDYLFNYQKDDFSEGIKIAFSEVGEPLRDYFIDDKYKTSKIGDAEIIITQYKQMYMASFKYKDIYFDIETNGITKNELVELLVSIIENL